MDRQSPDLVNADPSADGRPGSRKYPQGPLATTKVVTPCEIDFCCHIWTAETPPLFAPMRLDLYLLDNGKVLELALSYIPVSRENLGGTVITCFPQLLTLSARPRLRKREYIRAHSPNVVAGRLL